MSEKPSQLVNYIIVIIFLAVIVVTLTHPVIFDGDNTLYLEQPQSVDEAPEEAVTYEELTSRQKAQFETYSSQLDNSGTARVELTGDSASWSTDMTGIIREDRYYPIYEEEMNYVLL